MNRHPLVIVPCSGHKLPHPAPAARLYTGSFSRMALRAAQQITTPDMVRILSGLHGLLDPAQVIGPYEQRIDAPGAIEADRIRAQADSLGLPAGHPVIVLAGNIYSQIVSTIWPHAITPLTGCRGIGEQRQRLAQIIAATAPTAPPGLAASPRPSASLHQHPTSSESRPDHVDR